MEKYVDLKKLKIEDKKRVMRVVNYFNDNIVNGKTDYIKNSFKFDNKDRLIEFEIINTENSGDRIKFIKDSDKYRIILTLSDNKSLYFMIDADNCGIGNTIRKCYGLGLAVYNEDNGGIITKSITKIDLDRDTKNLLDDYIDGFIDKK